MARNVRFELRRGAGSPLEVLFGKVSLTPTMQHSVSTSVVLPAPTTFDLINGVVVATNVAPSPAPVEGMVEWAYIVKIVDTHGKSFEYMVGVPDGTTEINFNALPKYFETKPPLFGAGPQGIPGSAATVAVGTVSSGPTPAVSNTGTSTAAVLNFTLAQGPAGPTGAGVPAGGSALQVVRKNAANTTTEWASADKALVGLGNVDNTSDANKPVSTPQKTYIDGHNQLAANSKTLDALPSTYPTGNSILQVRASDGWPLESTGTVVTQKTSAGDSGVGQWLYPVEGGSPLYRVSLADGTWTIFDALSTKAREGSIKATDYPNVQAAVDAAFTLKKPLLIDTDIVDSGVDRKLFELNVIGKGSITINGNKFWVNPQHQGIQTNRLYLNPTTGNNLNSGIDPSAPIKTFTQLNINLTMLRERLLDGFWEIIIQAGTHMNDAGWRMDGLRTKWPLVVKGEGVLGTIIDGTNDTIGKAFYFKHFQTAVTFKNLHIRNYVGGSAAGADADIDTSAAIICQGPGLLRVEDCRIQDCVTGIGVGYGATFSMYGTTVEGSLPRSLSSTMSVGLSILYGASATVGTFNWTNTIKNATTGVHVTRNAVAHVDYNNIVDNYYGLQASHNARAAVLDGVFHRNMVGINMTGGAECTYATADFGSGATANTLHNVRFSGSSKFTQYQGAFPSATEFRLYDITNVPPIAATTGTTALSLVHGYPSSASVPAHTLFGLNKKIRFKVHGVMAGTGSRTIQFRKSDRVGANASYLNTLTVPAGHIGNFTLEVELNKSAEGGNFRSAQTLLVHGMTPVVRHEYVTDLDMSHDWLFRLYKTDSTTDNTMSIYSQEIYVVG